MFPVRDLVAQSIGAIIHRHPPELDPTRPKLMNLKFDLPRDAEEKFEPMLLMKLDDGKLIQVQFACKNTPWCKRCRWWFHTESQGCPRAEEEDAKEQAASNSGNRRQQQGVTIYEREFRKASRDPRPEAVGRGEGSTSGRPPPQDRTQSRQPQGEGYGWGNEREGQGGQYNMHQGQRTSEQHNQWAQPLLAGWQANLWGGAVKGGGPYTALPYQTSIWQQHQGRSIPQGNWTSMGGMLQQYSGLAYDHTTQQGGETGPLMDPRRENGDGFRTFRGAEEKVVVVDDSQELQYGMERARGPRLQDLSEGAFQGHSESSSADGRRSKDRSYFIPDGVDTRTTGGQHHKEKFLVPLICTLLGQEPYILGLVNRDGKTVLPSSPFCGNPSPGMIEARVCQLYADRFCFRIFPEDTMPRMTVDTPNGRRLKFYIPMVDARIPTPHWAGLPSVGLTCIPLRLLLGTSDEELGNVVVEPGISAGFLREINEKLPVDRNIESGYFQVILAEKWQAPSPTQERADGE
ncbi:hypothetical protein CBR_g50818 [Chara braunii]|uniref:Uncharacterized protein n=1 Tax=Chara braunii TaxID=69332 RepID=A0A388M7P2_CHABU|nr:hypothetical protein CBR_g50818 [Chara braunii]|eukprot:GBG90472.1 hypothetical protein CBR_g50818 [Chara braunii]